MADRIGGHVEHQPHAIAHVARSEQGQDDIGAGIHSPATESLAEVLLVLFHAPFGGDIEQPQDAHGAVDEKPARIAGGLDALALQEIIDRDEGIRDVAEEIADPRANEVGRNKFIALGHRANHHRVEPFVEGEHGPVETFDRILAVGRGGAAARQHGYRRRQDQ